MYDKNEWVNPYEWDKSGVHFTLYELRTRELDDAPSTNKSNLFDKIKQSRLSYKYPDYTYDFRFKKAHSEASAYQLRQM